MISSAYGRKGLVSETEGISRRSALLLVVCMVILLCLLIVSHDLAVARLKAGEGPIARASPAVRPYVVMSRPVEDWERDLYDRFRAEGLTPWQLGDELSKVWGTSLGEADVDAWLERMTIDAVSLGLFGIWFSVPGAQLLKSLYRAYGEYMILLGASAYVAYYAYLKPLLRQRVKCRGPKESL